MSIRVQRKHIDKWIERNGPDGLVKLAQKAGVSSSLMSKVRIGKKVPSLSTRLSICRALKVSEKTLFPSDDTDEEKAS